MREVISWGSYASPEKGWEMSSGRVGRNGGSGRIAEASRLV